MADCEPEPRAPVFTGDRVISLGKAVENSGEILGFYSGAGIGDAEINAVPFADADIDADRTAFGELDRIADDIDQDLPDPLLVADHETGDIRGHSHVECELFFLRPQLHDVANHGDQPAQFE